MITTWNEQQIIGTDFMKELKHTLYHIDEKPTIEKVFQTVVLDKPTYIYTDQSLNINFIDKGDYYYILFGQGKYFPEDKTGFAWLNDEHSIFFFERPFQNRVVNILKQLLPNEKIIYNRNDIQINGTKNGATLRTGYGKQVGDVWYNCEEKYVIEQSDPLSGMIYILRWDDIDGLNKAFDGNEHHKERLKDKAPLGTLAQFLEPIGITKEKFIELLEK